ncbi:DNA polymerase III subunit beta [Bacillus carboniphilus]|uniref:Beta sliding clamp n=1 Tax=Bacillus carboniphilus TaxID=86663 RepID=A0ABP3FHI9_9BACI
MRVTVQKEGLVKKIQDVMRAVSSKTPLPILTTIKLSADLEGLTLTGSNSTMSIQTVLPQSEQVEIKEVGAIALQAKVFSEIVKNLSEGPIDLIVSNLKAVIRSGKSEFKLNGMNAEEYPRLPEWETDYSFYLPSQLLRTLIRQTVFAVSSSETRPILTGVNWRLQNEELVCSATDSHLLALRKVQVPESSPFNIVIPGKSLQELYALLPDTDEIITMKTNSSQMLFELPHLHFHTRLLEGAYPDITRFITNEYKMKMSLSTQSFSQVMKRSLLLAGNYHVVKFISNANGEVRIISQSPEVGELIEDVETSSITGEETNISFNAKYMADALKAHDGDTITISFTGAMRPIIITSPDDEDILQLILPVRSY